MCTLLDFMDRSEICLAAQKCIHSKEALSKAQSEKNLFLHVSPMFPLWLNFLL